MSDLISIIVPVYNSEKYLNNCIGSIASQTYENLEIILVDDGSTDGSPEICDGWAKKDKRIRAIHTKNNGVAAARNKGIDLSKGEWICFVDSDDTVEPDFAETLINCALGNNSLLAVCGYNNIFDCKTVKFNFYGRKTVCPSGECLDYYFENGGLFSMVACKLINRDLFGDLRFKTGIQNEDAELMYKLIYKAKNVAFSDLYKYNYFVRENSRERSAQSGSQRDILKITDEFIEFCKSKGYMQAVYNCLPLYVYRCKMGYFNKSADEKEKRFCRDKLKKAFRLEMKSLKKITIDYSKREVARNIIFYISPSLYTKIFKTPFVEWRI